MNIGIMGAGGIATVMAKTINSVEGATLYAIGSRSLDKANKFMKEYNAIKAYGSYIELVKDENIDLIYIATPHSEHYSNMKLAIENNKNVLCEKAFTINSKEAKEIKELAKKHNVFVTEALWPRYMPLIKDIKEVLKSGLIGNLDCLTANLCYPISNKERITNINLAGGALLDIGVYGLNFMIMCFGLDIRKIDTSVLMNETGVDSKETITVFYNDNKVANLTHSIYSMSDRKGIIYGDKGYAVIENINNPESISVYNLKNELVYFKEREKQITGFEYELLESINCINNGLKESISMPIDESIKLMEIMDSIREKWGFKYPREL